MLEVIEKYTAMWILNYRNWPVFLNYWGILGIWVLSPAILIYVATALRADIFTLQLITLKTYKYSMNIHIYFLIFIFNLYISFSNKFLISNQKTNEKHFRTNWLYKRSFSYSFSVPDKYFTSELSNYDP